MKPLKCLLLLAFASTACATDPADSNDRGPSGGKADEDAPTSFRLIDKGAFSFDSTGFEVSSESS